MTIPRSTVMLLWMCLLPILATGLVLGLTAFSARHALLGLLLDVYASSFWGYVVLIVADLWSAHRRDASDYQRRFYVEVQRDVLVAALSGCVIAFLYFVSAAKYEASSFDILSAAVPFLVMGLLAVVDIIGLNVAEIPMKRAFKRGMLLLMAFVFVAFLLIAVHVASNAYALAASSWLQISVLSASLFIFVESRRVQFVLQNERMELSPLLLAFFGTYGVYHRLAPLAEHWNREVEKMRHAIDDAARERNETSGSASRNTATARAKGPPPLPCRTNPVTPPPAS